MLLRRSILSRGEVTRVSLEFSWLRPGSRMPPGIGQILLAWARPPRQRETRCYRFDYRDHCCCDTTRADCRDCYCSTKPRATPVAFKPCHLFGSSLRNRQACPVDRSQIRKIFFDRFAVMKRKLNSSAWPPGKISEREKGNSRLGRDHHDNAKPVVIAPITGINAVAIRREQTAGNATEPRSPAQHPPVVIGVILVLAPLVDIASHVV